MEMATRSIFCKFLFHSNYNHPRRASLIILYDFIFQSYAKMALIISIVASINPFNYIEMETPPIVAWAMENKLYACMMIFFISNAVETQLVSTGAFEISVDNMPVWSKIESGRIPQPPELFQIIDTHLKMNSGQETIDQQFNHQEL